MHINKFQKINLKLKTRSSSLDLPAINNNQKGPDIN